jgi:hypothetical protein
MFLVERLQIFISVFTVALIGYSCESHYINPAKTSTTQQWLDIDFEPSEAIGRNWIPDSQPRISACLNIANLVKATSNATMQETLTWTSLSCLQALRSYFRLW